MNKIILLFFITIFSLCVYSQRSGIGLGVILGEPTGLSAKIWTGENSAVDGALAWSLVGKGFIHIHADMLMHSFAIDMDQGQLPVYFGIGAKLDLASNLGLGVRVPIGLTYLFESALIDIFIELVPILNLIPGTNLSVEGGVGVRYFF